MVLGWSSAENALFVKLGDSVSVVAEQFAQNFVAVLSAFRGFAWNRKFATDDFHRIRQHIRTKDDGVLTGARGVFHSPPKSIHSREVFDLKISVRMARSSRFPRA